MYLEVTKKNLASLVQGVPMAVVSKSFFFLAQLVDRVGVTSPLLKMIFLITADIFSQSPYNMCPCNIDENSFFLPWLLVLYSLQVLPKRAEERGLQVRRVGKSEFI